MGQQISIEDAFPVYQKRVGELFDETLLLRAQVAGLERQLAAAQEENQRLQQVAAPAAGGPDLAAQPPYLNEEQRP
jgi:prefoldin subunit 5